MSAWTNEELQKIADNDDLHIAPFREDGSTYGTPTWIWAVVVDGDLYVRAYNGTKSRWYQAAMQQQAGRVTVAGMTKEVGFEAVTGDGDGDIQARIDDAYRGRYRGSRYLGHMIGAHAREATVQVTPRDHHP
ncbi:DUF2255 family protein [Haliangium ochraceum]|uniref:Uncharacterized conserved protein UCP028498 n=1 Tax=Haliangium ochraceum (strain DSM 14365 / JCM 11303 / SMP-2) TaxID=502025 RepID=D0LWN7_HALO1|nr:DUF2255 family protein [Haliangium ochraceum]ACY17687.1 Uncharacterized conserved protein UCP028498 [Haliangium ochraceum DSM 14365]